MREMKNSGVEWIGKLPTEWELLSIGSVYKLRNEKVNDTDFPLLSVSKGGIVPQMDILIPLSSAIIGGGMTLIGVLISNYYLSKGRIVK